MAKDIERTSHGTPVGGSREEEKLDELGAHATDDPAVNPADAAARPKVKTAVGQDGSRGDISPRDETAR